MNRITNFTRTILKKRSWNFLFNNMKSKAINQNSTQQKDPCLNWCYIRTTTNWHLTAGAPSNFPMAPFYALKLKHWIFFHISVFKFENIRALIYPFLTWISECSETSEQLLKRYKAHKSYYYHLPVTAEFKFLGTYVIIISNIQFVLDFI